MKQQIFNLDTPTVSEKTVTRKPPVTPSPACNVTPLPLDRSSAQKTRKIVQEILEGTASENTARSYARDRNYFWAWAGIRHGLDEHYPIELDVILEFIIAHTVEVDPVNDQQLVREGHKKRPGPYKISTLNRMLATISREHENRGLENPLHNSKVRRLKRQIRKLNPGSRSQPKRPITVTVLQAMLSTCKDRLIDQRDVALLLCGFASGGRRRSELANLLFEDLESIPDGYLLHIRKSKTDQVGLGRTVPLLGKPAEALDKWLNRAKIVKGKVFRSVTAGNQIGDKLSERAIDKIVKKRLALAGYDPSQFSSHSIRSGFMTVASRHVSLGDAMQLSCHTTHSVAHSYFRQGELLNNPAARLYQEDN